MIVKITQQDIDNVLSRMEADGFFEKINSKRKKYILVLIGGLIGIVFWGMILYKLWIYKYIGFGEFIGVTIAMMIAFGAFVSKFFSKFVKKDVAKNYLWYVNKDLEYAVDGSLFPISVDEFYHQSELLKPYSIIDFQEDSIKLEADSFRIYGQEIQTSKIKKNNKNYTRRSNGSFIYAILIDLLGDKFPIEKFRKDNKAFVKKSVTNHSYIILVEILKHRFPIKEKVKLLPDTSDTWWKKTLSMFVVGIAIWSIGVLISLPFAKNSNIWVYAFIGGFLLGLIGNIYWINKNRVKLENKKFEKIFDVYSQNEIESRRLLTPKLQEKLASFAQRSKFKWLAMTFVKDKIYMKFDVKDFMEVKLFGRDLKQQVKDFLTQLALLVDFVNWLNIEYFSQVEFLKDRNGWDDAKNKSESEVTNNSILNFPQNANVVAG